ncbi:MAG: PBP1A family penicillin-binding protein [bacterium]
MTKIKHKKDQTAKPKTKRFSKLAVSILIFFTFFLSSVGAIVAGMGLAYYHHLKKELPEIYKLLTEYKPNQITRVYADNGEQIAEFFIEKRIPVPLNEIPANIKQAIIAVEDSRFYSHNGIDLFGIARAFWVNIKISIKTRKLIFAEGASTITQQLVRLVVLKRERSPLKKLLRKLKEILLALKLEKSYCKDEILGLYLNQVYFGHGSYGIESASNIYFNKSCREFELSEAALLAGLPQSPNSYSPYRHPKEALKRRNHVLKRMFEENYINKGEFETLVRLPVLLQPFKKIEVTAPYFVEYIRQSLEDRFGSDLLYKGGLRIYTTLDMKLQDAAEKAFKKGVRVIDKRQGYRPFTGENLIDDTSISPIYYPNQATDIKVGQTLYGVISQIGLDSAVVKIGNKFGILGINDIKWTGASSFADIFKIGDKILVEIIEIKHKGEEERIKLTLEQEPELEGAFVAIESNTGYVRAMIGGKNFAKTKFNRVTQAKRQPGSAFKPLVYATAIELGYTPADIFIDSPIIYEKDDSSTKGELWKPENYYGKFYGPTTLRSALEHSRNIVTIKLLEKVGVQKAINMANRLGIISPLTPDLSIALGCSSVSLLELTSAYSTLSNEGIKCEPLFIKTVLSNSGEVLLENEVTSEQVITPQVAYIMTNLLRGVVEHGTGWKARRLGRPVAGKTGTTNRYYDAWFIGYSPKLVAGVWVGFDEPKSLGKLETGSNAACPIWVDFMEDALKDKPINNFLIPEGINFVTIDRKTGLLATESCEKTIVEAFIEGTEPTEYSNPDDLSADQFYKIDSDLENNNPDEGDILEDNQPKEEDVLDDTKQEEKDILKNISPGEGDVMEEKNNNEEEKSKDSLAY